MEGGAIDDEGCSTCWSHGFQKGFLFRIILIDECPQCVEKKGLAGATFTLEVKNKNMNKCTEIKQ